MKTRSIAFAAMLWCIFIVAQVHHAAAVVDPALDGRVRFDESVSPEQAVQAYRAAPTAVKRNAVTAWASSHPKEASLAKLALGKPQCGLAGQCTDRRQLQLEGRVLASQRQQRRIVAHGRLQGQ